MQIVVSFYCPLKFSLLTWQKEVLYKSLFIRWLLLWSKYVEGKCTLLSGCAGASEPSNCQCHSSAAPRWVVWDLSCLVMKCSVTTTYQLTSFRGTVCQQSGVWQGGWADSCCWEWAQHLAECHPSHSQEVPAGEPRYTKGIYAKFIYFDCDCRGILYHPTALLLETFQDKLQILQDKLQILQYQNQLQQERTDRLLEELATLKNTSMDGMILVSSSLFSKCWHDVNIWNPFQTYVYGNFIANVLKGSGKLKISYKEW